MSYESTDTRLHRQVPAGPYPSSKLVERLIFFFLLITIFSLQSFRVRDSSEYSVHVESDFLAQLIFTAIFFLAVFSWLVGRAQFHVHILPISFFLLVFWCAITISTSAVPEIAMRRFVYNVFIITICVFVVSNLAEAKFHSWTTRILLATVLLSWLLVLAVPSLGIHQQDEIYEANLKDLWRGIHFHKNIAGALTAVAIIFFVRAIADGHRRYWLLLPFSIFFLYMTGAKTAFIVLMVSPVIAGAVAWVVGTRSRLPVLVGGLVVSFALVLVANQFLPYQTVLETLFGDSSFTGRNKLWQFIFEYLEDNPVMGSGFGSFFGVGFFGPLARLDDGFYRVVSHAHNGYLEMAASTGWPGFGLTVWVFVASPLLALARSGVKLTRPLYFMMTLWIFGLGYNMLGGMIMQRARAEWVILLLAVLYVHKMTAVQIVAAHSTRGTNIPGSVEK